MPPDEPTKADPKANEIREEALAKISLLSHSVQDECEAETLETINHIANQALEALLGDRL